MTEKQAEMLARVFSGEAWKKGDEWLAAFHRGDGKYVVFSGDAVTEYNSEEDFKDGKPSNSLVLADGEEEWWVVGDEEGNTFYNDDELETGWRFETEAEHEADGYASRESDGGKYFAKRMNP